jgi:hypothetical protein
MTKMSSGQQPTITRSSIPAESIDLLDYENWQVELTGQYWPLRPTGSLWTQTLPGNLRDDLGIEGWKSHPAGSAVVQFSRRHKIVVEGIKYRLNGGSVLHRELILRGQSFAATDQIQSTIKIGAAYAGYERDLISYPRGFIGISLGLNYMEANAGIVDLTRGVEQASDTRLAFPVAGGAFRVFPGHSHLFNVNGEIKGMNLGNYGSHLDGSVNMGLSFSRTAALQLGFRALEMDLHNKFETEGVRATFMGPTFAIQWRNR